MTEVVNFRMNSVIKDSFKKVCKSHNMSMSSRINDLIIEFMKDFESQDIVTVPDHLRNNSRTYINPHNFPDKAKSQSYFPDNFKTETSWRPNLFGWEKIKFDELQK